MGCHPEHACVLHGYHGKMTYCITQLSKGMAVSIGFSIESAVYRHSDIPIVEPLSHAARRRMTRFTHSLVVKRSSVIETSSSKG